MDDSPELVNGYPSIARLMGLTPEYGIIRRFATLSTQSLLYRQAELMGLERQLRELELRSATAPSTSEDPTGVPAAQYSTDWWQLGHHNADSDQWQLFLKIRDKVEQYGRYPMKAYSLTNDAEPELCEIEIAVLRQVQMAALPDPDRLDLEYLQGRFEQSDGSVSNFVLTGLDKKMWLDPKHAQDEVEDLMALRARANEDPFTTWVADHLVIWLYRAVVFRWRRHRQKPEEDATVSDEVWLQNTAIFTTLLASLLPVGSIAILYHVQTMNARLGLIAAFTVLFALSVLLFTSAKRVEILAATAA